MSPKDEVTYINREIQEYMSKADQASMQGNDTQRLLAGQLIWVAATIVTLSAAFLTTDRLGLSLGLHSRWVLVVSWIAFTISITSGIVGLILDAKYFLEWQRFFSAIGGRLGTGRYTSATIKEARKDLTKPKDRSPFWPLYVQTGLLALGGLAFLALIIHLEIK